MKIKLSDWLRELIERWWTCPTCGNVNEDSSSQCANCRGSK